MEEERTTYRNIREWAMDSVYQSSQASIIQLNRNGLDYVRNHPVDIFGAFFSETHESLETDLEELMWRTFELIILRGLGPQIARDECNRIINNILSRNTLDDLLQDIPEDEANELRRDLKLLKFID